MEKSFQNHYLQHILAQEFLTLLQEPHDLKLSNYPNHHVCISQLERAKVILEQGLNLEVKMDFDFFGQNRTLWLIEKIFSDCQEFEILSLVMKHLDFNFFSSIGYQNQCEIMNTILEKNISQEHKKQLLEVFFKQGFKVKPDKNFNSRELSWIQQGYITIFELIVQYQRDFPWNHLYDGKNILTFLDEALLDSSEQLQSKMNFEKEIKIIAIKDLVEPFCNQMKLEQLLPAKEDSKGKTKI